MDSINFLNLQYIYLRIFEFFKNFDIVAILNGLIFYLDLIKPIAIVLSLFLFSVIVYATIKLKRVEEEQETKFHATRLKQAEAEPHSDPVLNQKWIQVEAHINSSNPSDWRLAILEADIMLGDILEKMGYQGDSIGDKLKGIDKSEFVTIDLAWEAHKVRNQIAHEGSDYMLNERDAKRVIDLFKRVFEEFYYI
ncbi:MAG: hypothetical protein KGI79_02645 [Patescibacteria group bacterium]|nr:hypothetical protein [Patescibacteria group bacterium]MDE2116748.1 hypothetical protein [Patescibacteria group bacterium]